MGAACRWTGALQEGIPGKSFARGTGSISRQNQTAPLAQASPPFMTEIFYADEFKRRYQELPGAVQRKAERREKLFRQNPFHPSLQTEKLKPKEKEYWSFRIDDAYRILFRFNNGKRIIFLTCGHHNWIYNYVLTH